MNIRSIVRLLFWAGYSTVVVGGTPVSSPLGFQITIPDGFENRPDLEQGKQVLAYERKERGGQFPTMIVVTRLHGVIGNERIDEDDIKAAFPEASAFYEKWRGLDVFTMRVPQTVDGRRTVGLQRPDPARRRGGAARRRRRAGAEEELRALLQTLLADFDGHSNLLNDAERSDRMVYLLVGLIVTGLIAVAGWSRHDREAKEAAARAGASLPPKVSHADKYVGRSMLIGAGIGAVVGAVWMYLDVMPNWAGALGGALLGGLGGLFAGLPIELLTALVIRPGSKGEASKPSSDDALWASADIFGAKQGR